MQFPLNEETGKGQRSGRRSRPSLNEGLARPRHNVKANNSQDIARATFISMLGFFMAKVTGFLREVLVAPKLGFGMYSDPYYVAFFIPDLLYALLIGGAVAATITPSLSAGIEQNREREVWHSVNVFISLASIFMVAVLFIVGVIMPWLLPAINPGKDVRVLESAIPVSRILLIQCVFMTLISLTQGVLTAYKRFGLAAFGVMIYNIFYMLALSFFGEQSQAGLVKVAWGVVGSAFIYLIYQILLVGREIKYFRFSFDYGDKGFKRLFSLAIPTLLSGSVVHINSLVMNLFTNQFVGAPTAIRHAEQAFMLPYGIIAIAIGTVMLPNLTGYYARRDFKQVRVLFTQSIRKSIFYIAPLATIFFVLDFETIQLIFQWDPSKYTSEDVTIVGNILQWFCISLFAQTIIYMTNQAFYARRVTRIALFAGLVSLVLNPVFCILYIRILNMGVQGIAMAHASYSLVSCLLVYFLYKVHNPKAKPYRILPYLLRIAYCVLVTGIVLSAINLIPLASYSKVWQLVTYAGKSLIGIVVFYIAGISIQLKETLNVQKILFHIFGRLRLRRRSNAYDRS